MAIFSYHSVRSSGLANVKLITAVALVSCIYMTREYQAMSDNIKYDLEERAEFEELLDDRRAAEEKYKRSYDVYRTNKESIQERIQAIKPEIETLNLKLRERAEKIHPLEEQQNTFNQQYKVKEEQLTQLRLTVVGMRDKIRTLRDDLTNGKNRISSLENEIREENQKRQQEQERQRQMNMEAANVQQPLAAQAAQPIAIAAVPVQAPVPVGAPVQQQNPQQIPVP